MQSMRPNNRAPMSRPFYPHYYFPINADGYSSQLYRSGGYTVNSISPNPCQCCTGFSSMYQCQYGKPCSKNICGRKPDFVSFQQDTTTFPTTNF